MVSRARAIVHSSSVALEPASFLKAGSRDPEYRQSGLLMRPRAKRLQHEARFAQDMYSAIAVEEILVLKGEGEEVLLNCLSCRR